MDESPLRRVLKVTTFTQKEKDSEFKSNVSAKCHISTLVSAKKIGPCRAVARELEKDSYFYDINRIHTVGSKKIAKS